MFLTMSEKLKNTDIPKLQSFGQSYYMIENSIGSRNELGDTNDFINHVKSQGGLQ